MTVLSIARPATPAPAGRVGWLAAPALGSTTAVVLLALSIAIVVSSAWAARRIGRVA